MCVISTIFIKFELWVCVCVCVICVREYGASAGPRQFHRSRKCIRRKSVRRIALHLWQTLYLAHHCVCPLRLFLMIFVFVPDFVPGLHNAYTAMLVVVAVRFNSKWFVYIECETISFHHWRLSFWPSALLSFGTLSLNRVFLNGLKANILSAYCRQSRSIQLGW